MIVKKKKERDAAITGLLIGCIIILVILLYILIMGCIKIVAEDQYLELGTDYEENASAELFGFNVSFLIKTEGDVNVNQDGTYELHHYIGVFPSKEVRQVIYVGDWKSPTIMLLGDTQMYLMNLAEYEEPGYEAIDNRDGDITEKVITKTQKISENEYNIQYEVSDNAGNVTIGKRVIYVENITGVVYLTFDDGPSSNITPKILDLLKEKEVKATFFVVGFDQNCASLVERAYSEGHSIGLHGYSHDYKEIYVSLDFLMENFHKIGELVKQATGGYESKLIRFPGGSSNTVSKNYCWGIMTVAVAQAEKEGYTYFDWNVDSADSAGAKTAEEIYQNVIAGVMPGRENIVLMHDSATKEATLEALPMIIDYLIDNGYDLRALNEESATAHHKVSN